MEKLKLIGFGLMVWVVLFIIPLKFIDYNINNESLFLIVVVIWALGILYGVVFHWWIYRWNVNKNLSKR
jgi:hypothetical protein